MPISATPDITVTVAGLPADLPIDVNTHFVPTAGGFTRNTRLSGDSSDGSGNFAETLAPRTVTRNQPGTIRIFLTATNADGTVGDVLQLPDGPADVTIAWP